MVVLHTIFGLLAAKIGLAQNIESMRRGWAFDVDLEPYYTEECWSQDVIGKNVEVEEPKCVSFDEPFGGFRYYWYPDAIGVGESHLEHYGNCIIQVWADTDCTGEYIGQVQGAAQLQNIGSCARIGDTGLKGRSVQIHCLDDVEGDVYETGMPPPDTHWLRLGGSSSAASSATVSYAPLATGSNEGGPKKYSVDIPFKHFHYEIEW